MKLRALLVLSLFLSTSVALFPMYSEAAAVDLDGDRYYVKETAEDALPPFARGEEKKVCDEITITQETEDADQVIAPEVESISGRSVNPGEIEAPNSKVDYNCDGRIAGYLPEGQGGNSDLFGLIQKVITLIGQVAVFISVGALIYGGILFATASGDELKMSKAKKTIIGAVIGLAIGLVAWKIVGFVTATFG